jgi:hypothetical protein
MTSCSDLDSRPSSLRSLDMPFDILKGRRWDGTRTSLRSVGRLAFFKLNSTV